MDPQMVLRPKAIVPVLTRLLTLVSIVVISGILLHVLLPAYAKEILDFGMKGVIVALIAAVGVVLYLEYKNAEFLIYGDRIDYKEYFLTQTLTSITLKNVTSITIRRTPMDRLFGTASFIVVPIGQNTGVEIPAVVNYKTQFAKLLELQALSVPLGPGGELQQFK